MRVAIALVFVTGCGAEFMPSARHYDQRIEWEEILVLEEASTTDRFETIGTVIARAKRATHAIDACRKEASKHGGDAVIATPLMRGGEWRCSVLRRPDQEQPQRPAATETLATPATIVQRQLSQHDAAKEFADAAKQAFDSGDFETAIREFEYAYSNTRT